MKTKYKHKKYGHVTYNKEDIRIMFYHKDGSEELAIFKKDDLDNINLKEGDRVKLTITLEKITRNFYKRLTKRQEKKVMKEIKRLLPIEEWK